MDMVLRNENTYNDTTITTYAPIHLFPRSLLMILCAFPLSNLPPFLTSIWASTYLFHYLPRWVDCHAQLSGHNHARMLQTNGRADASLLVNNLNDLVEEINKQLVAITLREQWITRGRDEAKASVLEFLKHQRQYYDKVDRVAELEKELHRLQSKVCIPSVRDLIQV